MSLIFMHQNFVQLQKNLLENIHSGILDVPVQAIWWPQKDYEKALRWSLVYPFKQSAPAIIVANWGTDCQIRLVYNLNSQDLKVLHWLYVWLGHLSSNSFKLKRNHLFYLIRKDENLQNYVFFTFFYSNLYIYIYCLIT